MGSSPSRRRWSAPASTSSTTTSSSRRVPVGGPVHRRPDRFHPAAAARPGPAVRHPGRGGGYHRLPQAQGHPGHAGAALLRRHRLAGDGRRVLLGLADTQYVRNHLRPDNAIVDVHSPITAIDRAGPSTLPPHTGRRPPDRQRPGPVQHRQRRTVRLAAGRLCQLRPSGVAVGTTATPSTPSGATCPWSTRRSWRAPSSP